MNNNTITIYNKKNNYNKLMNIYNTTTMYNND